MVNLNEYYDFLAEECLISTDTLDAITGIYGWNEEVLDAIAYWFTGFRDFEQLKEFY